MRSLAPKIPLLPAVSPPALVLLERALCAFFPLHLAGTLRAWPYDRRNVEPGVRPEFSQRSR